jgi:UDP-2-acetamido-2,6-beta-L-arabino-hexul-4-ose reductase
MVIGNGLLARTFTDFQDNPDILIFASGVSNSLETGQAEFDREKNLLDKVYRQNPEKKIVYFSTCSVMDPTLLSRSYTQHKLAVESFLTSDVKRFIIFRVSNIVGKGGNPNTLFNFLTDRINKQLEFELWGNAYRNIIGIEEVKNIISYAIQEKAFENEIVNIANPMNYSMIEIVRETEKFLNIKSKFKVIEKGSTFKIPVNRIKKYLDELNIDFSSGAYIPYLLNKYYS